jgi:hypothetical protein
MRAIQISEFGGPEVLKVIDVADPVAGENEILLPPGNKFKIKEMFMAKFNSLDLGSSQQGYESTLCDLDEFKMK